MRAVTYRRLGPADEVLRVEELDEPRPAPGEVRVRVRISGVNPTDVLARAGGAGRRMPFDVVTPHHDGAGVIDAVGDGVDRDRVGQRVWVYLAAAGRPNGTAAEWVTVPARQAVPLPAGVDAGLAASLGIPAMTAHRALFGDGPIEGATVLVSGGAGSVGHFAIELARRAGAVVVATVSTSDKARSAKAAGADLVVNYRDPDAAAQVRSIAPNGVDRVIEVNLPANAALDQDVLAPGGTVVCYSALGAVAELPVRPWMYLDATIRFLILYRAPLDALDRAAADITAALRADALTALPEQRFPLDRVAEAHAAVEAGVTGKVLLELPD
ncbi:NADPH:quinone reductase [Amycolatopsis arida]|uniref:NADPH:quinone reductase n=1 Tax=Amycolatopsis arida TaxID=587909 RepID=A0A1I5LG62_9PSEU|nr:NADPH:quinone reductase [Amycolatopsis arida]TDX93711.1 NADPH:quinone reductase-like Zn-dependent oxidoreductase [Amycolatopsis arida]SFO96278.1 NADPH:quinone reductase [Amycolatopsis arida]